MRLFVGSLRGSLAACRRGSLQGSRKEAQGSPWDSLWVLCRVLWRFTAGVLCRVLAKMSKGLHRTFFGFSAGFPGLTLQTHS